MKKLTMVMAVALLLAGCSKAPSNSMSSKISDDKTLITVQGTNITKQNLFEEFVKTYGPNQILNQALQTVAEKEITDFSNVDKSVQSTVEQYSSYMGGREAFEKYVVETLGYESLDAYAATAIKPQALQQELLFKYIDDNFEAVTKEHGFVYVKCFTTDKESDALAAISSIDKQEVTFEQAAENLGAKVVEETLISDVYSGTAVDSNIAKIAPSLTKLGTYSAPVKTSDEKYAVVVITKTDLAGAEEAIDSQLSGNDDFAISVESYYLQKYNFEVYEPELIEGINAISDKYLKTSEEEGK